MNFKVRSTLEASHTSQLPAFLPSHYRYLTPRDTGHSMQWIGGRQGPRSTPDVVVTTKFLSQAGVKPWSFGSYPVTLLPVHMGIWYQLGVSSSKEKLMFQGTCWFPKRYS
jgi:hypothetical protein